MANLPDIQIESPLEASLTSEDDDELDPRIQVRDIPPSRSFLFLFYLIQIELERLNHANEAINNLELQLDVIKSLFFFYRLYLLIYRKPEKP
jgi:hypothetical protein